MFLTKKNIKKKQNTNKPKKVIVSKNLTKSYLTENKSYYAFPKKRAQNH